MGERDFKARYRESKQQADDAAWALEHGEDIKGWRYVTTWIDGPEPPKEHLEGRAWIAWMYEIALENARTLVSVHGSDWQYTIKECDRLVLKYRADQEYTDEQTGTRLVVEMEHGQQKGTIFPPEDREFTSEQLNEAVQRLVAKVK